MKTASNIFQALFYRACATIAAFKQWSYRTFIAVVEEDLLDYRNIRIGLK